MALVARRSGKRRRLMADINVVPYVDVMLVLVVILMVAAPFVNPGVVQLPTVEKAGQQEGIPLRVVVRANGAISILDAGGRETTVAKGQLAAAVQGRLSNADTPVVIEGDSKVQYEAVVGVMNILKNAGIKRVGLLVAR
ncbi:MAG TPA: biopolymer transporter ExbD [Burkholderiaceae bacterium]|nr:biopolymer transporter ExbD [Burkholderiaceae bacterium]